MSDIKEIKAQAAGLGISLLGMGASLPGEPVSNADMAKLVDTSDEWIVSRTGISGRHFVSDEQNIDLAEQAARSAIAKSGVSPEDIGVLLVATFTPDRMSPSTACCLRARLGLAEDAIVFDINAACAGFLYALSTARNLLISSSRPCALVVGSEVLSRVLDFTDRSTCVLFGDGAAAAVITLSDNKPFYYLGGSREDTGDFLYCSGSIDKMRGNKRGIVHMQGQEVFRFAVDIIPYSIEGLLNQSGLALEDIDYVVCHQANIRIINHVAKKMKARPGQFFINLQELGNTSAASIPLALCDMERLGLLRPGVRVMCVGFGAGFTWGGCLLTC